jgi:pimeloyl-ACP methyl ester carboxylesterase
MKRIVFGLFIFVGGCAGASSLSVRQETAARIAAEAGMTGRVVLAGMFSLKSYERIGKPGAPVAVYIEGDGLAWVNKHMKSLNPTPPDPIALRLAAADGHENVVYLARPCQYTGWTGQGACPEVYWTSGVTAPEVIAAYREALDAIKARTQAAGFHLVGYSGGAAVAALAAAERQDVLSLRTVAGNLDHAGFAALHGVSPLKDSIDPASVAGKLATVPQVHFIGAEDAIVPSAVFEGWERAGGASCVHSFTVPGVSHEKGWAEAWPELLAKPLSCD